MITEEQYAQIEEYFPKHRKPAEISNIEALNAIFYVLENGCKWRKLPKEYGNWHTIYTRMNRWAKSGVLQKIFYELQKKGIIKVEVNVMCIDSTSVKVHPDGTGALKKVENRASGEAEEDLLQKFIWCPHLIEML